MDKNGNIRKRDGQWHYRFRLRGKEYSGPTGYADDDSNRILAEEFALAKREQLGAAKPEVVQKAPKPIITGSAPFEQVAEEFLHWCQDVEYATKRSTATRIRTSFVTLTEFFGKTPVRNVDAAAVESYKAHRLTVHRVRPVTLRHDLHALSVFFGKYAVRRGIAKLNPVGRQMDGQRIVSIPSDNEAIREHVISAAEEARYFAAAESLHALHCKQVKDARPNMMDLARLMLEQGARPDELLSARISAYSPVHKTLLIEGGKSRAARRTLYLSPASILVLERRAAGEWLFPSGRHAGHHLGQLNTTHDRICREAGVSFCIYDFRHTFATRAIEAGVPVAVVAAILGHASLRTIHRYVHPSAEAQRAAMERIAERKQASA